MWRDYYDWCVVLLCCVICCLVVSYSFKLQCYVISVVRYCVVQNWCCVCVCVYVYVYVCVRVRACVCIHPSDFVVFNM
jgi:hypothetical protein